jgi:hypothetical protein
MKLTQVRYFSHATIILICCCSSIAFAESAAAADFSFPNWIELSPNDSPPARSYLAMTYDPVSGKIIAFGGFDGTGYLNDTWSFDGTSWTQIVTQSAPPARTAAQMTYDSVTQKVVLFGGFDGTNYLGDTWLWDGSTLQWTQGTPKHQPPAVTGPMLFPDPNGSADLFGGFDGQFYQLTMWQWDVPTGRSYFHRRFRLLVLQRPLLQILPRDKLLCLAGSLMLTRITPGPTMARHGPCNLRLCNLS